MKKDFKDNKFINQGYFKFKKFNSDKCKKLNNSIANYNKIDRNIFFSRKKYEKFKNKKFKKKDILDRFKIDFILKDQALKKRLNEILGKNYKLYAQRIICGIPKSIFPKWIKKEFEENVPNLTKFIKPKYRYMRYLFGADFHNDHIDFSSNEKPDFITVYVYLSKVTQSMAPLILLPKSHLAGNEKYPHNLKIFKNKVLYYPKYKKKILTSKYFLLGNEGEAWGWHAYLLHGTNAVSSKIPRFSLRLIFRKSKFSNSTNIMKRFNDKISKFSKKINN